MSDKNKDGCVSFEEYEAVLKQHNVKMSRAELEQMYRSADRDGDGRIDGTADKAKAAFAVYDRNKDGRVSKAEMKSVSGKRLDKAQIEFLFSVYDKNGDGYLNKNEMADMMRQGSLKKK